MKDYASMSDQEINREVQKLTGMGCMSGNGVLIISDGRWRKFDPCNNPADAWPVITTNRIVVIPAPEHGEWWAAHRVIGEDSSLRHFTQHGNPLRAAMIVFLKMMERG